MRYVLMLLTVGAENDFTDKEEVADQVREKLGDDFPVVSTSEMRQYWS